MKKNINDIRYIADLLDTKFKLPNGWRFGWDGILGLIPGLGNVITDVLSFYILFRAAIIGCSPAVLIHMALNVLIDNLVDKIPILGLILDFVWKANTKNIMLLESHLTSPESTKQSSKITVILSLLGLFVLLGLCITLTVYTIVWVIAIIVRNIPG